MEQSNVMKHQMEQEVKGRSSHRPELMIFVAAFSAFLATFNETFLNVAFTSIMADLGVGVATVQWLSTAYMLGAAVMVPISAFLYRSIPTKRLYLFTVGLLVVGSVVCGLAPNFTILLLGRIIQAFGHWDVDSHWDEYYIGSGTKTKIGHLYGDYGCDDNFGSIFQCHSGRIDFSGGQLACHALVFLCVDSALYDLWRMPFG